MAIKFGPNHRNYIGSGVFALCLGGLALFTAFQTRSDIPIFLAVLFFILGTICMVGGRVLQILDGIRQNQLQQAQYQAHQLEQIRLAVAQPGIVYEEEE